MYICIVSEGLNLQDILLVKVRRSNFDLCSTPIPYIHT